MILLYCPKLKCGGTKEISVCVYLCPKATVLRCPEYCRVFPQLKEQEVDPKYIEKYGERKLPVPPRYLKRKRRSPKNATAKPAEHTR